MRAAPRRYGVSDAALNGHASNGHNGHTSNGNGQVGRADFSVRMPIKRCVDLTLGTTLAAVSLPFITLFALIVAIELRAWPFFVQERIGRYGVPFRMPKLRTLPKEAHPYADKFSFTELLIPRFCRFLRDSHIDELPQLWLVPIGKMSLVGPRPKMPDWAEPIDPSIGWLRTRIRPGCTGLWQIGPHSHLTVSAAPQYDKAYMEQARVRLDFWILWRTVARLFGGQPSATFTSHDFRLNGARESRLRTADSIRATRSIAFGEGLD